MADALHRIPGIVPCDPLTEEERREGRGGGRGEGEKDGTDGEEKGEGGKKFNSIQNTLLSGANITIKRTFFFAHISSATQNNVVKLSQTH